MFADTAFLLGMPDPNYRVVALLLARVPTGKRYMPAEVVLSLNLECDKLLKNLILTCIYIIYLSFFS